MIVANPWSTVTGEVTPPPWQGESHVHRMPDDEERKREAVEKREAVDPSLIARREVAAHVEAGEMPAKVPRVGPEDWRRLAESQQALIEVDERIRVISERYGLDDGGEAGEMEAAKDRQ